MPEFFTSPTFFAVIAGFIVMYVVQVVIRGPREAERKKRVEEYTGRLSHEAQSKIETVLASGDKLGAIKIFREETNVGLVEAKEAIAAIKKQMTK